MMEFWYSLLSLLPFTWAQADGLLFMKNAFLAVLVITPLFGLLSTMVVTNKMSFFSDALGHSAFTGMAVGTLAGALAPTPCAVVFAVVFALNRMLLTGVHPALADSRGIRVVLYEALFAVAIAVVVITWLTLLVDAFIF